MKVSIRTAYRIVKKTEDPESPIFIPQYQEEGSEEWHTFMVQVGRNRGNPVYFYVFSDAINHLDLQKRLQDVVVHYEDDESEWTKNLP
jgi:hypothetical protein